MTKVGEMRYIRTVFWRGMAQRAQDELRRAVALLRPLVAVKRRLMATLVVGLFLAFVFPSAASAHTGDQTYLYLDVTETALAGRIELPISDLEAIFDFTIDGTIDERNEILAQNQDALVSYVDDHVSLGQQGANWEISYGDPVMFESDEEEISIDYVVVPFDVDTADSGVSRELDVTLDPFFDEIEDSSALLLIGNDWEAGVIENGDTGLSVFESGSRSQTIELDEASALKNLYSSMKLGVKHIQTGPDHILFVLVLLLPSVLIFRNGWQPAEGFGSALWRVLKIVTMFTIAHSITFTLAGLGLLPLQSPRIVESIIALSIAAAALHNIRPIAPNKEWLISFIFGLFHGMGFASLVSGLEVSRSTQLVSLLGRNIGIEIGQAFVVLVLFPGLFLLRRTRFYRPFFIAVSVIMIAISLAWMVERLFETSLGVDTIVDPAFNWPWVLGYVAVFTAIAGAVFLVERGKNQLLPVAGAADNSKSDSQLADSLA